MPAIRLVVGKKVLAKPLGGLEAYDREACELLATGANIQEQAVNGELPATNAQVQALTALLFDRGLQLILDEDGDLKIAVD